MFDLAPPILASEWLNTPEPLTLAGLRGRVVAVECFQMLCPDCVSHGLPQAQRITQTFRSEDVAVIGLHAVFEHHTAQGPASLAAFVHEYRIRFPVAVDLAGDPGPLPQTMARYGLKGTPSLLLIDRDGRLRAPFRCGSGPCPRGRDHGAGAGERECPLMQVLAPCARCSVERFSPLGPRRPSQAPSSRLRMPAPCGGGDARAGGRCAG